MTARLALAAAALGLCGCTTLTSTLAPAPALSLVGVATPAVPLAAVDAELARLQADLERRLVGRDWGVPVQLSRGAEAWVRVRLAADASFDGGSAQLQPGALLLYAELAAVMHAAPATVAHVLVHGDAAEDEPAAGLTARRAASVASYLAGRGIAPTRLRAEGRGAREPASSEAATGALNRRVELVFKPVIAGQEAEAWRPPAPSGCGECTADPAADHGHG